MEVAEGFKATEIGQIPSSWEVKKLSEISTLITNGFVGTIKSQYTDAEDGVLYIQGYNVEENSFNFTGIKRVTKEFHRKHSKSNLQEGDLLTIQTGEIGLTTIVPRELAGSNCHALIITRLKKGQLVPKYFSYYFNSFQGRQRLREIETGSTMKHLNVGDIIHYLVPIPTKAEQTAIATALSDTDSLITSLEKLIDKKRKIKQGVMQELLRPKEGWKETTYGDVFTFLTTATYSRSTLKSQGEAYYVHYGDIHTKWNTFVDFDSNSLPMIDLSQLKDYPLLEEGASEDYAGVGKSVEVRNLSGRKAIAGLHTFLLRDKGKAFVDRYKGYLLFSDGVKSQFHKLATGMKVYGVSKAALKTIRIFIPPIFVQQAIVERLDDMRNEIDVLEGKLSKLKKIKAGMMQSLLTGKIRLV